MLNIDQIREILPHRYPFLMVDRVVEVTEQRIVAYKNISANEPQFNGHFPTEPILPGVLIVEAMAQAGGLLAHHCGNFDPAKQGMYFMTVEPLRKGAKVWKFRGRGEIEGDLAGEAEFMATLAPR